jgi:hypothetical protein
MAAKAKSIYAGELWAGLRAAQDLSVFKTFKLNTELNYDAWPNGADFAPEFLYDALPGGAPDKSPAAATSPVRRKQTRSRCN